MIGANLFGKTVSDLQENMNVLDNGKITGTLKYVDDYTEFSSDPSLQSGNYLVIHADVVGVPNATISVKVTNPVELDEDRTIVLHIADKDSQTVTVVASAEGYATTTKVFDLKNLVCESSGQG